MPAQSVATASAEPQKRTSTVRGKSAIIGVICAVSAVIIIAATLAVSRLAVVSTNLTPADLLALRFGIGGALFLPVLLRTWSSLPLSARRAALPLSFSHGWGVAGCSLLGLTLAPASHAGALGPGCVPIFVAAIGFIFFRKRITRGQAIGLAAIAVGAGILLLTSISPRKIHGELGGDLLFVAAAVLAAGYFTFIEHHRVPAFAGHALVVVVSAFVVLPVYLFAFESNIPSASLAEVGYQVLFQGVLMSLAHVAMHKAVLELDGTTMAMIASWVPVVTLLAGRLIAGDPISFVEILAIFAITWGILYGTLRRS